jgi:phosphoribosylformylglycinamidine cyclo-ligase
MVARKQVRYKDAGVNIDEADRALVHIKRLAQKTFTRDVVSGIGAFGAGFRLAGWKSPVLVSSADGVGTKLKVAFAARRHDTVGQDLVNHCVNDIAVQGARPLFFLDYYATGKLDAEVTRQVVFGLAKACGENGCALIGGETAEMPGFYAAGEYDLAGFIVGAVERNCMLTGAGIRAGDMLLGLPSTGLHTNGYSLARKLLFDVAGYGPHTFLPELGTTVGEELLKVHRSYLTVIQTLLAEGLLKGAAHITGGGMTDNIPRVLARGLACEIDRGAWSAPPVFELLRRLGNVPEDDYRRAFNLGIGMVLVVSRRGLARARRVLDRLKEPCFEIGRVIAARRGARSRVLYL